MLPRNITEFGEGAHVWDETFQGLRGGTSEFCEATNGWFEAIHGLRNLKSHLVKVTKVRFNVSNELQEGTSELFIDWGKAFERGRTQA